MPATPMMINITDSGADDKKTKKQSKMKVTQTASKKNDDKQEGNVDLSIMYQKKTDKQHVLDNPDTYTGSMEKTDYETFIYEDASNSIIHKHITIIPGLYKLFDEAIVNCRDHQVRMDAKCLASQPPTVEDSNNQVATNFPVTNINVSITDDGIITFMNDGNGIDIAEHPEHKLWIPEMIFGHLRTSTNYNKGEKKIVGGKNGFGVKLVFIWSSWGKIETVDHTRGLKYTQVFKDNLNSIEKPIIVKSKVKPYTIISFKPDYERLGLAHQASSGGAGSGTGTGIKCLTDDMIKLFKRRVYDIAAITHKKVKVRYNNELIPVKNFQQYIDLYIGDKSTTCRVFEEANERWEYAVCLSPKDEFSHVSFVNGIFTNKGGKHVDYILNQIVRKLISFINKKKKIEVNPSTIKEQLMIFVRCDIENPSFDSQTKDYMNTPISNFGSSCEVSDNFVEKIAKMGVMDAACSITEIKELKAAKKNDGTKTKRIRGIPKLIDANFAGTDKSSLCTLILCEGDSAKAGIVSGLSKDDRNIIGIYPMRGKLFNVRGETKTRIFENKEITEMKQILGLEIGQIYSVDMAKTRLRYGKIVFMTDQDLDGSHIKGLGINLFDSEWSSLLEIDGFIGFMNTPILKAKKGVKELTFYTDGEYSEWKNKPDNNPETWKIKYYKGLGTSTAKEFKEYFQNKKMVEFKSNGAKSRDSIDMVFNKKRAPDRKSWLEKYDKDLYLDTNQKTVTYDEFIEREMIHFSKYDCERSIPNMMDGLKTSQRKIIFTAFKRRLFKEIKVAQFSGSVSELSCYHHGEQSLNGAIINMAQNFVGSNNINLFEPNGQFGTRLQGGEDSASERYIFTNLSPITRTLFKEDDDSARILDYINDDGTIVEPTFYVPILPMILVNGSKGIGTGFSTDIMCYNPLQVADYIIEKISTSVTPSAENIVRIEPYYEGFKGTITPISSTKYLIKGKYEILSPKSVRITELPVGVWTDDYKEYLEGLISFSQTSTSVKPKSRSVTPKSPTTTSAANTYANMIKDYVDMSTDKTVDITITLAQGVIEKLSTEETENGCNSLEKMLKLYTTKSTTNMHMFDENEKLCHFKTVEEIVNHFIKVRMTYYLKRKQTQLAELKRETMILSNRARFINDILTDAIDLRKKKIEEINIMLKNMNYDAVLVKGGIEDDTSISTADYKYLTKMPMDMVTEENVQKLLKERDLKISNFESLESTKESAIWINELDDFKTQYKLYIKERNKSDESVSSSLKTHKIVKKTKLSKV